MAHKSYYRKLRKVFVSLIAGRPTTLPVIVTSKQKTIRPAFFHFIRRANGTRNLDPVRKIRHKVEIRVVGHVRNVNHIAIGIQRLCRKFGRKLAVSWLIFPVS